MYGWLVGVVVRRQFDALSRGDSDAVLARCAPNIHHRFAGQHALGGERHDLQATRLWFARLNRLCPRIAFTVHRVLARGWPWDVTCAAEWSATVTPAAGPDYRNCGVHIIRVRRGKVVELLAYEDSQVVADALRLMAELGVAEASEEPITSAAASDHTQPAH